MIPAAQVLLGVAACILAVRLRFDFSSTTTNNHKVVK